MEALHHVLRIEHPSNQRGPFRQMQTGNAALMDLSNWLTIRYYMQGEETPDAAHVDIDKWELTTGQFVCGVEYFSQLYTWFGTELSRLWELGYNLVLYVLPKRKILFSDSGLQVAFNPAEAISKEVII